MIFFQRKLRAKFIGSEEYRPKEIPMGKFIPVVGFSTQPGVKVYNGKEKRVDELMLVVIGNDHRISIVHAFNCHVEIDNSEGNALQALERATMLCKSLSEMVMKVDEKKD